MIYASGMETNLSRLLNFLPALVLVGFMIGCGGNTASENNSTPAEGNQSVPPKSENNSSLGDGKAATDTANKPKATKFTPEMMKAAWESAFKQLPEFFTEEVRGGIRAGMQNPEAVQAMVDDLNKKISDGKVVDPSEGVVVDAITVEALAKSLVIALPSAKKKAVVSKSTNNAKVLCVSLQANSDENEGKFPAFDEWCDAILRDMNTLAAFISPQHPDAAKLMASLPKLTKSPPVSDALPSPGKGDKAPPPPDQATSPKASPKAKYPCHYAFNKVMAGKIPGIGTNHETVLVFECDLGWNGAGGLEDALKHMEKHKLEKIAVATADGAARAVTKEELKKLKWEISP